MISMLPWPMFKKRVQTLQDSQSLDTINKSDVLTQNSYLSGRPSISAIDPSHSASSLYTLRKMH